MKKVALALPPTHVFEGMREVLATGHFSWEKFAWASALNVVFLIAAGGFFLWMLKITRSRGLLTKFATQ